MKKTQAVALKYPSDVTAPVIAVKEKGRLAEKMIEIAEANNIPVVKDDLLTEVLLAGEIGECIPEDAWYAVAEIFAYIKKVETK